MCGYLRLPALPARSDHVKNTTGRSCRVRFNKLLAESLVLNQPLDVACLHLCDSCDEIFHQLFCLVLCEKLFRKDVGVQKQIHAATLKELLEVGYKFVVALTIVAPSIYQTLIQPTLIFLSRHLR